MELAPRARSLLSRIQHLSAKYLPPALCKRVCRMPNVISTATVFDNRKYGLNNIISTINRNLATNMIIELTDTYNDEDDTDNIIDNVTTRVRINTRRNTYRKYSTFNSHIENSGYINANYICHQLGPNMDLNSTFIRYLHFLVERNIPAMMFQNRMPYHHHSVNGGLGLFQFEETNSKSSKKNSNNNNNNDPLKATSSSQVLESGIIIYILQYIYMIFNICIMIYRNNI